MKCWLKSGQRLTIGRQLGADFSVANDSHMSRNHLVIEGLEDRFRIRDLGSSNGTLVNEFAISMVELCDGDRIQAGGSVFEVEIESDSSPAAQVPLVARSQSDFGVAPSRVLHLDQLTHDQEVTMRYSLDSLLELPLPGSLQAQEIKASIALTEQHTQAAAAADEPSDPDQAVVSLGEHDIDRGLPSKFLAGFTQSSTQALWRQTAEAALWEPVRLVDCLLQATPPTQFNLILNRLQLSGLQERELDAAISQGEARSLTETLYLMWAQEAKRVLAFYKSCLTRDAAICVAADHPLSEDWLDRSIDAMSYPSMLFELLIKHPERSLELTQSIRFILFEPNLQGELCLLRPMPSAG